MSNEEQIKHYDLAKTLIAEQNFRAALAAGAVATLLSAAAYGITVATWAFSYGFAAAAVGILVGLSMAFFGRGISTRFAVAATLLTLIGGVLGNLFRVFVELARAPATYTIDVLADRAVSHLSFLDLVYWFVAVFAAVFLAKRPLSRSERLAIGLFETGGGAPKGKKSGTK